MALRIKASSLFVARSLALDSAGVAFQEATVLSKTRRFAFGEIDCILMSPDQVLSFQVGTEVFSIPTKPSNKKHQETIRALVQCVRDSTIPTHGPKIA